jgi:hypothetical protein
MHVGCFAETGRVRVLKVFITSKNRLFEKLETLGSRKSNKHAFADDITSWPSIFSIASIPGIQPGLLGDAGKRAPSG